MFKVIYHNDNDIVIAKLFNCNTGEFFSFLPSHGAAMNQLTLESENNELHQLLDAPYSLKSNKLEGKEMFKGSKLFPFPNRLNLGKYNFAGEEYKLPISSTLEKHALHGLVTDCSFKVFDEIANENFASVTIIYSGGEFEGYPFKFDLKITYKLSASGFSCTTSVINKDKTDIPIGDGWHPYFSTGTKVDDLLLQIPSSLIVEADNQKIPTGNFINQSPYYNMKSIGKDDLDTCFKLNCDKSVATIKLFDKIKSIPIHIWCSCGDGQYQYVQIYIPSNRMGIAIEPMTCIPNAFNNKIGLIVLAPNKECSFTWGITLKEHI